VILSQGLLNYRKASNLLSKINFYFTRLRVFVCFLFLIFYCKFLYNYPKHFSLFFLKNYLAIFISWHYYLQLFDYFYFNLHFFQLETSYFVILIHYYCRSSSPIGFNYFSLLMFFLKKIILKGMQNKKKILFTV
jgi:hypothetical protein